MLTLWLFGRSLLVATGQRGAEPMRQLVPAGSWGSMLLYPDCGFLKAEILTWNRVLILHSLKVVWRLLSLLVAGLVCVFS